MSRPLTADEWAARCAPWAAAIAARPDDAITRKVCADWFAENCAAAEWAIEPDRVAETFRDAAVAGDEPAIELMLGRLGGRILCPACRPPLAHIPCAMCGGTKQFVWGGLKCRPYLPRVALDSLAPANRRWTQWSVGVCGHPTMLCEGWGEPVRLRDVVVIDLGRVREFRTRENDTDLSCEGVLTSPRAFVPAHDLAPVVARYAVPSAAGGRSHWMGGGGIDALTLTAVYVTDWRGRLAGRIDHVATRLTAHSPGPIDFPFGTAFAGGVPAHPDSAAPTPPAAVVG